MSHQRVHRPDTQAKNTLRSQPKRLQSPSYLLESRHCPIQQDIDIDAFQQHRSDAFGPQSEKEFKSIAPAEQDGLGSLPEKTHGFWIQRIQKATIQPGVLEMLFHNSRMIHPLQVPQSVQPKLTLGQPSGYFEQEADRVAEQVMRMAPPEALSISPQPGNGQQDVQTHSLAETISPFVIRNDGSEDDRAHAKHISMDQMQEKSLPGSSHQHPTSVQGELESRMKYSGGVGTPLSDEVRSFMEPRFGADFSEVRVHTNDAAVQMNRLLGSHAFTHKQHVYFGAGQSPAKDALTAHELTHVIQQKLGQPGIGMKVISPGQKRTDRDWLERDMNHWALEIGNLSKSANTFVRSVIYNTQNNLPDEYVTIAQRSAYYDVIDALAAEGFIPKKIRFFGAAAKVTGKNGVGSVEAPIGWALHSQEAIQILTDVNRILFESNIKIINRLMGAKGQPFDPRSNSPEKSVSPIQFDLNMVEVEQAIVESYLKEKTGKISAEALADINDDLNFRGLWRTLGEYIAVDTQPMQWAKKALGKAKLNFMQMSDRIAIGKALVLSLHSCTVEEYMLCIKTGAIPADRLREHYRTPFSMGIAPVGMMKKDSVAKPPDASPYT